MLSWFQRFRSVSGPVSTPHAELFVDLSPAARIVNHEWRPELEGFHRIVHVEGKILACLDDELAS